MTIFSAKSINCTEYLMINNYTILLPIGTIVLTGCYNTFRDYFNIQNNNITILM